MPRKNPAPGSGPETGERGEIKEQIPSERAEPPGHQRDDQGGNEQEHAAGKAVLPRVTGIAKAEPAGRQGRDIGQQVVILQPQIHLTQEGVDRPDHQGYIDRHLHRDRKA